MNFHKIILICLFFWFGNTVLFACFCQTFGFCEVLTDTSHVVEAKVVKIYNSTSSNKYFIDIEITDFLYGSDTLSFDRLTIVDNQTDCDALLYNVLQPGDLLVYMFEQLGSDVEGNYPTFSLDKCNIQYLYVNGEAITGIFVIAPLLEEQTANYESFKDNIRDICHIFLTTPLSGPLNFDLNIFPNPVHENLKVKTNSKEAISYSIYSHTGEVVKSSQSIQRSEFNIDFSDFSSGMYYLQVKIEGKVFHEKIIKI